MKTSFAIGATAPVLGVAFACAAVASEPASHDVTVPTSPGRTVVVEWTGTALPGASGINTSADLVDPSLGGCLPVGPDDSHTINLVAPADYGSLQVTADFHIEWEGGEPDPVGLWTDPDLKLTVYHDTVDFMGWSDGGAPEENVGLNNPASGSYTAVVCPFLASEPTPYRGRLTLRVVEANACIKPGLAVPNAPGVGGFGIASDPEARGLPNFDVFQLETATRAKPVPTHFGGRHQAPIVDTTLGVPTFLWARTDARVASVGPLADERERLVAHARAHLRNEAKLLKLDAAAIAAAQPQFAGFNGDGPAVVRLRQHVDGVEVFHRHLNVLLDRGYRPVAVSGYFATESDRVGAFALDGAQAIANAWTSLGGALDAGALTLQDSQDEWLVYARPMVAGTHWFEREPRVKRVYYPRADGLEPAYYVELLAKAKVNGNLMAYGLVVSALDGTIRHRQDLKSDAHTYRVFADTRGPLHQPFDSPLGNGYAPLPQGDRAARRARVSAATSLITLEHAGIVTRDPWLAPDATVTTGNNVDACIDEIDQGVNTPAGGLAVPPPVNSCLDGVEPRAPVTGPGTFDYELVADEDPESERAKHAATVNLFYMNNWLHDWWYNHGFDEASGNAQKDNYGRGGLANDRLLAQGQDGSGRNNANMATPADGSSPVMQQYLFDGPLLGEVRQVAPVAGAPLIWTTIANAGDTDYDFDGELVLADDGTGVSPSDGCGPAIPYPPEVVALSPVGAPYQATVAPPQASLQGKIALVDRGNCNTTFKVQFALASGAIGVIVVNNIAGDPPTNIGNLDIPLAPVQPTEQAYARMPTVIIRQDDGAALKAQLAAGQTVTMHMARQPSIDADGTLDNQIIAHEFFHYVHHRLTDSSNQQARAMSEGWGDIDAFMLTVRPEDALVAGNGTFGQPYALAGYSQDDFLKGIRRVPYSASFADNAFTLKHIANGTPTPDGGAGATNSQVHASGEIWANMMFECYVNLLTSPGHRFGSAQSRMQDYIIAGFKMTPADATYTEGRDAVLAAALATNFDDYKHCSRGFAKRGAGLSAVAPPRASTTHVGVVEDFSEFVCSSVGPRAAEGLPESRGVLLGAFGYGLLLPLLGLAWLRRRRAMH